MNTHELWCAKQIPNALEWYSVVYRDIKEYSIVSSRAQLSRAQPKILFRPLISENHFFLH